MLWLFILAIVMFFAALTSAFLVQTSKTESFQIVLPIRFIYSTLVVLLSSFSIHQASRAIIRVRFWLLMTFLLGCFFLYSQYQAWGELVSEQIYLVGHPKGSFLYIISGAHAAHVLGGLLYLLIVGCSIQKEKIKRCAIYWHFLSILWLYLYGFFYFFS
ncbi:MAG: cytochrome oxidase subunit III [Cytophagales bacterium]|nr:cytochrome oxidase subunit III [Cytophagales bacterium]